MAKRIIAALLCFCAALALFGCSGNNRGLTKIVGVRHAGKVVYLEGNTNYPFTIKELNLKSEGQQIYLGDYIYDANGTEYAITDRSDKKIGTIKLSRADCAEEQSMAIDIDEIPQAAIYLGPDLRSVEFYSSFKTRRELQILIMPRVEPLEITLNGIDIYSPQGLPCFVSLSEADLSVKVVGNNSLTASKGLVSESDLSQFDQMKGELDGLVREHVNEIGILSAYAALTHTTVVYQLGKAVAYPTGSVAVGYLVCLYVAVKSAQIIHEKGLAGFTNEAYRIMENLSNQMLDFTQKTWDLLMGASGTSGTDGMDALLTPGAISFYGDGYLTLTGADGTDGTDARAGLDEQFGGNGGNGGRGVVCQTYINIMDSSHCSISGGNGGTGGKGSKALIDSHRNLNGSDGKKGTAVDAMHKYEK